MAKEHAISRSASEAGTTRVRPAPYTPWSSSSATNESSASASRGQTLVASTGPLPHHATSLGASTVRLRSWCTMITSARSSTVKTGSSPRNATTGVERCESSGSIGTANTRKPVSWLSAASRRMAARPVSPSNRSSASSSSARTRRASPSPRASDSASSWFASSRTRSADSRSLAPASAARAVASCWSTAARAGLAARVCSPSSARWPFRCALRLATRCLSAFTVGWCSLSEERAAASSERACASGVSTGVPLVAVATI